MKLGETVTYSVLECVFYCESICMQPPVTSSFGGRDRSEVSMGCVFLQGYWQSSPWLEVGLGWDSVELAASSCFSYSQLLQWPYQQQ